MDAEWLLRVEGADPIRLPTWEAVESSVRALDGAGRTMVVLDLGRGDCLMVGGGDGGRYLVDFLVDQDTQEDYVLVDPSLQGTARELTVGGQTCPYPAWACVGLPLALRAVRAMYATGGFPPDLVWTDLISAAAPQVFEPSRRASLPSSFVR